MLAASWSILTESAIFILVGFALAGLLRSVLNRTGFMRLLREARPRSVFLATLIGVPLPLCSCSVLPTAITLRKNGSSNGATLSFLVSTPETSISSVLLTYSLLGPLMAIVRPIAACVTAIAAGLAGDLVDRGPRPEAPAEPTGGTCSTECASGAPRETVLGGLRYAFIDLFDDIFGWIVVGILAAAALQAWLPPEALGDVLGGPLQSMLLMVLIGVPLYVCAEASTPVAAALIAQGVNPGAALVFLLVGPATNIGSLGVLVREMGRRLVAVYLVMIVGVALVMGMLLNMLLDGTTLALQSRALDEPLVPIWLKVVGAVVFLVLGLFTARRRRYLARGAARLNALTPFRFSPRSLLILLVVGTTTIYAASGLVAVQPGEVGVVRWFGAVRGADLDPGLHYAPPPPFARIDRVPVLRIERLELGAREGADAVDDAGTLVGDENIAAMRAVVHWGGKPGEVLAFRFGVADPAELVRSVVLGAEREVLGGKSIGAIFTVGRHECEREILHLAQERLDRYRSGVALHAFRFVDTHAPSEVHAAFRDVASALEDRATAIDLARAEEARIVPRARGEAARMRAEAEAYRVREQSEAAGRAARFSAIEEVHAEWPGVTRKRLRLETLEQVLPGMRKYLKPPTASGGELEIWFVDPEAAVPGLPSGER